MANKVFYYAENVTGNTNLSNTDTQIVSVTFTPTANKTYLYIWSAQMQSGSNTIEGRVKLKLGTASNATALAQINIEDKFASPSTEWHPVSGVYTQTANASPVSTTVVLTGATASPTSSITDVREARLLILELTENDAVISNTTNQTTTSTAFSDAVSLVWTPSSAGDYVVIGSAERNVNTGTESMVRIAHSGSNYGEARSRARASTTNYHSGFHAVYLSNLSGQQTANLQFARSDTASGTCTVRNPLVTALRVSDFPAIWQDQDRTRTTTTGNSAVVQSNVATTSATTARVWVLGSAVRDLNSTSELSYTDIAENDVALIGTASEGSIIASDIIDLPAGEWGQFVVKYPTSNNASYQTRYWSNTTSGVSTGITDSQIVVFQLEYANQTVSTNTNSITAIAPSTSIAIKIPVATGGIAISAPTVTITRSTLRVELRQNNGNNLVASWTIEPTTDWAQVSYTLSESEFTAVTDWSNLQLWLIANGKRIQVAWVGVCAAAPTTNTTLPVTINTVTVTASEETQSEATKLNAATNTITATAPTATKSSGTSSKSAGINSITVTASEETQAESTTILVDTNTLAVAAAVATTSSGAVGVAAGANILTVEASAQSQNSSLALNVDATDIEITAPATSIRTEVGLNVNTNEVIAPYENTPITEYENTPISDFYIANPDILTASVNTVNITTTANIADTTTTLTVTASEESQSQATTVTADTNIIDVTAPTISSATKISVSVNTNTITVAASEESQSQATSIATDTNTVDITASTVTIVTTVSVLAGANTITATASEESQSQVVTVISGTNTITGTAAEITIATTVAIDADANTITITAEEETQSESVVLAADTNTILITAPEETQSESVTLTVTTNTIVVTAEQQSQSQATSIAAETNTVDITAPTVSVATTVAISANTNTITVTASEESQSQAVTLDTDTNAITGAAPTTTVEYGLHVFASEIAVVVPEAYALRTGELAPQLITITAPTVTQEISIPITSAAINSFVSDVSVGSSLGINVDAAIVTSSANTIIAHLNIPVETNSVTIIAAEETEILTIPVANNTITSVAGEITVRLGIPVETNTIPVTAPEERMVLVVPVATNTIRADASGATAHLTAPAETNTIDIATPSAVIIAGDRSIESDTNTITITAAEESQRESTTLTVDSATITISAAPITVTETVSLFVNANRIDVTAEITSLVTAVVLEVAPNVITIIATEEAQQERVTLPVETNQIDATAGTTSVSIQCVLTTTSASITVNGPTVTVSVSGVDVPADAALLIITAPEESVRTGLGVTPGLITLIASTASAAATIDATKVVTEPSYVVEPNRNVWTVMNRRDDSTYIVRNNENVWMVPK